MNRTERNVVRAFLAARLPLDLAAILHKKARHRVAGITKDAFKWVAPQHQHVTLKFLGSSTQGQLSGLTASLERELVAIPAFDIMTGRFDFFPDASRPRVLALHMHSGQQLKRIAAICEESAVANGFERDSRHFQPHVTLARLKRQEHVRYSDFFTLPSFVMGVREIVLMQSQTLASGPVYKTLHTFPLLPLAQSA